MYKQKYLYFIATYKIPQRCRTYGALDMDGFKVYKGVAPLELYDEDYLDNNKGVAPLELYDKFIYQNHKVFD